MRLTRSALLALTGEGGLPSSRYTEERRQPMNQLEAYQMSDLTPTTVAASRAINDGYTEAAAILDQAEADLRANVKRAQAALRRARQDSGLPAKTSAPVTQLTVAQDILQFATVVAEAEAHEAPDDLLKRASALNAIAEAYQRMTC